MEYIESQETIRKIVVDVIDRVSRALPNVHVIGQQLDNEHPLGGLWVHFVKPVKKLIFTVYQSYYLVASPMYSNQVLFRLVGGPLEGKPPKHPFQDKLWNLRERVIWDSNWIELKKANVSELTDKIARTVAYKISV